MTDTAGLDDTSGPTINFANTVSLVDSLSKSKEMIPIIVIPKDIIFVGRGNEIRDSMKIILRFFKNIEDNFESILFIISKVNNEISLQEEGENIASEIWKIKDATSEDNPQDK